MPRDQSNEIDDSEDSYDDSPNFVSGKCYIGQSNSPVSDGPRGLPIAVDRPTIALDSPTKIRIYEEDQQSPRSPRTPRTPRTPRNAGNESVVYIRPRARVSREYEKSALDEIEFSGDDTDPPTPCTPARIDRRFIDTSSPMSVRHAVSRFGGTVDWKCRSFERRKNIEEELEKAQEEIPVIKQQTEAAEEAKAQVFDELEATNKLIEELKATLEKATTEEQKAKQDYEQANLRVNETEQRKAEEASVAANEHVEDAKSRHEAAVSELKCVKEEMELMQKEYSSLLNEKEAATERAQEALSASKEVERTVEELSKELGSMKESLESARVEHQETEEKRFGASMDSEQDSLGRDKELKKAKEDIEELEKQVEVEKDLKGKLNAASALLASLKSELAAYLESKVESAANEHPSNRNEMQVAVVKAKNELEETKLDTEKAIEELKCLKMAATSLRTELEQEKSELISLKQREGMARVAVASLEAELEKTKSEISTVQTRETEARDKNAELPKQLQVASREADEAKSAAEAARKALGKAKEESDQAKAEASTVESRLFAAQKEIEAARASEKLAMDSIRALQVRESAQSNDRGDPSDRVTLPWEVYNELSKRAQEAEEQAIAKVASAVAQIEAAKEAEARTLSKLEAVNRELGTRKEVHEAATDKVEKSNEAKLSVEQELRTWRAEHEQQRKADSAVNSPRAGAEGHDHKGFGKAADASVPTSHEQGHDHKSSEHMPHAAPHSIAKSPIESGASSPGKLDHTSSMESSPDVRGGKKKKKSFMPKFLMIFNKKKSSSKT